MRLTGLARWIWLGLVLCVVASCVGHLPAQEVGDSSGLAILAAAERATVAAIESAEHAVVAIARVRSNQAPKSTLEPLRFGDPFPLQDTPDNPDYVPEFFGSGVVLSEDGYIVTCAHVLDDPRNNDYYVWLDKQSYAARVIGKPAEVQASDPFSDLAVLKIDAQGLTPMRFSKAPPQKGQFVIALGNPQAIARDGQASASWGIISNLNRFAPSDEGVNDASKNTIHHFGTLIQTDAKLNLGSSGGALINLRGEMIGLTSALAANSGFEYPAGFAIAVDPMFLRVVETLKAGKLPEYGFLGIQPEDLRLVEKAGGLHGARVSVVIPGLPGEEAGLQADDIIFRVGEQPIEDRNDLFRELSQSDAGARVELSVHRFRPGRTAPLEIRLTAELSKKLLPNGRPSYARFPQAKWRGMLVEYTTAVSPEALRGGMFATRRSTPTVTVLLVDPNTPAWQAGLRPGHGILAVDGAPVETPQQFYDLVAMRDDALSLTVARGDQRVAEITVQPGE